MSRFVIKKLYHPARDTTIRRTMSTLKQPASLLELSYRESGLLLYDACRNIEKVHGNYDQEECFSALFNLQQYLFDTVVTLFDTVGEHAVRRHASVNTLRDSRILYAVTIHNHLESFWVPIQHSNLNLFFSFICDSLKELSNLIHLDLSGIDCCDAKLKIIGNTCKKLKHLTVSMPGKGGNCVVTDKGFACLSSLRDLRVLKDSSGKHFVNMHKKVALDLLKVLTKLEEIDFCFLAEIIDSYVKEQDAVIKDNPTQKAVKPLSLTHIKIDLSFVGLKLRRGDFVVILEGPNPNLILSLARACPNLSHLHLTNFELCPDFPRQQFIQHLTSSSIELTTLALDGFTINDINFCIEPFLKKKGNLLKTFIFSTPQVNISHVKLISQLCPNMPNLRLARSCSPDWIGEGNKDGSDGCRLSIIGGL